MLLCNANVQQTNPTVPLAFCVDASVDYLINLSISACAEYSH